MATKKWSSEVTRSTLGHEAPNCTARKSADSLNETRYCFVCGKSFAGYDVQLKHAADGEG